MTKHLGKIRTEVERVADEFVELIRATHPRPVRVTRSRKGDLLTVTVTEDDE